jgi:hypothetical protein
MCTGCAGCSGGICAADLGFLDGPACRFESHVLANAQRAAFGFEQVAHIQRALGGAQTAPGIVLAIGLDFAARLVILGSHAGRAGHVRRPAELLARRIFHPVDPIHRHRIAYFKRNGPNWLEIVQIVGCG